ncbi:MAG: (2Fe-2S)-binding protein [Myxococcales bacterium]|jgi:nitrite reductase (NADH) large subunit
MTRRRHAPTAPADTLVCRCNGVTRGDVLRAMDRGRGSVQAIAADTAAGASCGSCRKTVARLLRTRGRGSEREALCGCTDLDHEEVRHAIARGDYHTVAQVMRALSWRTPDGCPRCRPALNYYLTCADPAGYRDDPQSRVVGERRHANMQRDGTYSVVPRVFGGVLTPAQLRAIADAAEAHDVPMVKLTGAQRIDLLGVRGDDLPAVWQRLEEAGLISGHAYARGVRNVKTCVGEQFCRFGLADAVELGTEIEEMTWGADAPNKVKMAVSACARNCAEATIKDVGVVAVEEGWDIYVGGGAGMRVRPGRRLTRVDSERELLEHVGAFLQLYREEGHYGERTGHFVERVGMQYAIERVVRDPAGRGRLFRDLTRTQRARQHNPWAELPRGGRDRLVPLSRLRGRPS